MTDRTEAAAAGRTPMEIPSAQNAPKHLILVRHAQPHADPLRESHEWELTQEGHKAAIRLAAAALFDQAAGFYAGPETRMMETLTPAAYQRGQDVKAAMEFAESRAGAWLSESEFLASAKRFFYASDCPAAPGWEAATLAVARFATGVGQLRGNQGATAPVQFAVASGGRMLSAYLATVLRQPPEEAFENWRRLRMPDVAVLELDDDGAAKLVVPFGTWSI